MHPILPRLPKHFTQHMPSAVACSLDTEYNSVSSALFHDPSFQWWWGCYLMFPFVSVPHQNHCLLYSQLFSLLPYLHLHCPSISSVVFLGFFSHWYSCSVMLLLAAVRFPFLIHARTNLVFALLFCQPNITNSIKCHKHVIILYVILQFCKHYMAC